MTPLAAISVVPEPHVPEELTPDSAGKVKLRGSLAMVTASTTMSSSAHNRVTWVAPDAGVTIRYADTDYSVGTCWACEVAWGFKRAETIARCWICGDENRLASLPIGFAFSAL